MIPDYYKILNIPPGVSIDVIKKAYRTMAMKCHPDRGGNHKDMVLVNEAWEVLSNPKLRQNYDYARTHQRDIEAQRRTSKDVNDARARAENYPQSWDGFEAWINKVFEEYGKGDFSIFGIKFPSAGKSFSGWIFILGGAAFGLYIANSIYPKLYSTHAKEFASVACVFYGAWLGAAIHKFIIGFIDFIIGPNRN